MILAPLITSEIIQDDNTVALQTLHDMFKNDFYIKCLKDIIKDDAKNSIENFYNSASNITHNLDKLIVFLQKPEINYLLTDKVLHNMKEIRKSIVEIKVSFLLKLMDELKYTEDTNTITSNFKKILISDPPLIGNPP